jgi:glycosyltransferase involved in cell wall biosynthesis
VHVDRALDLLRRKGIDARLYEQTGKSDSQRGVYPLGSAKIQFLKFLLTFSEDVIHFQFNKHLALAMASQVLKLRRGKEYLITVHSERPTRLFFEKGALFRRSMRGYFRGAKHLICVNQNIADFMTETLNISPEKTSLIPAFLPPTEAELAEGQIPDEVVRFIESKDKVIGTHGWFGYFVDGNHVYGFEHIARLAREIADSGKNIGIYTVISGCYETAHREKIIRLQQELSDHWLIVESPFSCAALYQKTDLFLRPTLTDGDSVSIRECLSLGVPVLASDAVERPPTCHTFPTQNYQQFAAEFWRLLDDPEQERSNPDPMNFEDDLLRLFENLLSN